MIINNIVNAVAGAFNPVLFMASEYINKYSSTVPDGIKVQHNSDRYVTMQAGCGISSYSRQSYGSGQKFPGGMSSSHYVLYHDHATIRQNMRNAMYDSPVARALVERFTDTVVETGLKLKPTPMYSKLGITPEAAEEWAENVGESFHLWAKSKGSHRSGINNFYQNQRLYQFFQQRDNDNFVRFFYSKEWGLLNPLQLEFVDPNQIRGYAFTNSYMQGRYDDGIIRDSQNREIGFKIWEPTADGNFNEITVPARGEKSGRTFMIHGYMPEYAMQGRGFSRYTHMLQEFSKLTDFKLATIQKAINQASISMTVENMQKTPGNPLSGHAAGPASFQYGSNPSPSVTAENVPETIEPIANYTALPEATFTSPSVGVFSNTTGDQLKFLNDTSPSQNFNDFVDSFCSYLSASSGMSIEMLLMKFNANYSASRAAMVLFWRVCQIWRDEMEADLLNPVYEAWLSEEIASGRISAPGWSDPFLRAYWMSCEWAGSPMPDIDPVKTVEAAKGFVELSAETLDDVARNHNGSSGKANRIKNARQFPELPPSPFAKVQPGPVVNNNNSDGDGNG